MRRSAFCKGIFREVGRGQQIDQKAKRHADAGGGKPVVPAELFAERSAYKRSEKGAEIDTDIENRKSAIAAPIARRVERANLGRDVRFKGAVAENKKSEREQKQLFEGHHDMPDGHQGRLR